MDLDLDLRARQEARVLAAQAEQAQRTLGSFPQEKLDAIVEAVAARFSQEAQALAEQAVRETGFGNAADKTVKNRFASLDVAAAIRDMKTVGILRQQPRLWEVGV
ncbi:MAG: acetaldehyde dehydrogenase, partial [Candidatus Faecousia sp.]|nr:acetaldehyde dehydrogenase [Candidatus Faecousia sp.]